jgi:hypothetical protein
MNTGICKGLVLAVAVALSGCSDGAALGFLQDGLAPQSGTPAKPFTQVEMVQGDITLVPPAGFCVDPASLTQTFAILARCDVLGGRDGALDAPLSVVTISFVKATTPDSISASVFGDNIEGGKVTATETLGGLSYLRVRAQAPSDGLSDVHWHAVDQLNGYDVAVALYAPDGSAALGTRGPRILQQLLDGSEGASVANDVATRTLRPKAKPKKLF